MEINNNKADMIYPFHPQFEKSIIFALLIILATLIAYSNSFKVPFIFDDKPNIVQNPSSRTIYPLINTLHPPFGSGIAGRPVINFTLAINYAISKKMYGAIMHLIFLSIFLPLYFYSALSPDCFYLTVYTLNMADTQHILLLDAPFYGCFILSRQNL